MKTSESIAMFAITTTVLVSFIYFIFLDKIKKANNCNSRSRIIFLYALRKITGFLLLGLVPATMVYLFFSFTPGNAGFFCVKTASLWLYISGASLFFITLNIFNSKNVGLRAMYPELRLMEWNITALAISIGGWVLYLTAYEYLFRGILLLSCIEAFGLWPAVTINLALYAALHLPKGMKEAIAAIPFGALLCYLTIESHSLIPAVFIHSVQAISCELFCIWRNPNMKIKNIAKT